MQRYGRWQQNRSEPKRKFKFDWPSIRSLATKGDREIKIAAVASAAFLGFICISPVSCYVDWKDTHRKVDYIRYEAKAPEPMIGLALSANNLEAYLHETWNRYSIDRKSVLYVADEFRYFIKENAYNERKLANEGGSDWTRPYLGIFDRALGAAKKRMVEFSGSVGSITMAEKTLDDAWSHSRHDNTHIEFYSCGTAKQPRTCTRTVCDSTDHNFRLDRARLKVGLDKAVAGWFSFPKVPLERVNRFFRSLSKGDLKNGEIDPLTSSPFVLVYATFLNEIEINRDGVRETRMLGQLETYPVTFHTNTPGCGGPSRYPTGWKDNEGARYRINSVTGAYGTIQQNIVSLVNASKALETDIAEIEAGNGHEAMRKMADLAWEVHNQNGTEKRYSYMVVKILLLGGWILVAIVLYSLATVVTDRYRHVGWLRRFYSKYD